ncbi:unnamed protein product [Haemonchus placei]|uniref:Integrase catalytic domain-containing protein n=1 Tax=Haemonchus placei TaxID=6290 RepID=A0A0N4W2K1_HAEPC|nr:unnamed protein product [Haemonchus placei]
MLLLACLNSRAIYVEVVLDMTASTALYSLRRFIATFGCPTWIICDNAKSFKTIEQPYASLPDPATDEDIIICVVKRIEMKFIPRLSPLQGRFHEKMVTFPKGSLKSDFKPSSRYRRYSDDSKRSRGSCQYATSNILH